MATILLLGPAGSETWLARAGSERALWLVIWIGAAGAAYLLTLQLLGQRLDLLWRRQV